MQTDTAVVETEKKDNVRELGQSLEKSQVLLGWFGFLNSVNLLPTLYLPGL